MGAGTGEETGRTWDCAAEKRRPPPHPTGRPHTPSSGPSTPGALGRGCRASGVKTGVGGGVPLATLLPQQKAGAGAAGTLAHTHTHPVLLPGYGPRVPAERPGGLQSQARENCPLGRWPRLGNRQKELAPPSGGKTMLELGGWTGRAGAQACECPREATPSPRTLSRSSNHHLEFQEKRPHQRSLPSPSSPRRPRIHVLSPRVSLSGAFHSSGALNTTQALCVRLPRQARLRLQAWPCVSASAPGRLDDGRGTDLFGCPRTSLSGHWAFLLRALTAAPGPPALPDDRLIRRQI